MADKVDRYFARGGDWADAAARLRQVLLSCDLAEELKWGKPCYMAAGGNIAILQTFRDFLALMFFKGALLDDPDGTLEAQGANTRSALRVRFRSVEDVERLAPAIRHLVARAIDIERRGLKVERPAEPDIPEDLLRRLEQDPDLAGGFERLTRGRQREYCLHIARAKRPETRERRIDACRDRIVAGRGLRD